MRAVAVLALLLAVALAGCSGPPGLERDDDTRSVPGSGGSDGGSTGSGGSGDNGTGGDGTTPPPTPRPERAALLLAFDLEDCSGLESLVELDVDSAQAVLPDGYTVHAAPGRGDPVGADDVATARYVWVHCGGLRTASSFVNDTVFGFVSLRVEAPEDAAEADEHWYRFRMLAQDDVLAQLWDAAGYEVYAGEYGDASQANESPLGGVDAGVEDRTVHLGAYAAQGVASPGGTLSAPSSVHYTETDAGRVEWVVGAREGTARSFAGDFQVADDDPLRSTATTGGLEQRYLDAAAWTDNDLWLRA